MCSLTDIFLFNLDIYVVTCTRTDFNFVLFFIQIIEGDVGSLGIGNKEEIFSISAQAESL